MSQPFIGEIRMFGGSFAPQNWAFCNGQTVSIGENPALFSLIGTIYGGDGVNTFALPNLQCRVPVHQGNGLSLGQLAGEENHTLLVSELPFHSHAVSAKTQATTNAVSGGFYGGNGLAAYKSAPASVMNPAVVLPNMGGQPHDNMMPFVAVSFIIALAGIYPTRS